MSKKGKYSIVKDFRERINWGKIMNSKKFRKLSLPERSAETFRAYINNGFDKRIYSDSFLTGICNTRREITVALGKNLVGIFGLAAALAYFDLLPPKVQIMGNEFTISSASIPIINLMFCLAFLTGTMKTIDSILIDRYINTMGYNISIFSFNLLLLDKGGHNLWLDPLTPRVFGEKSGFAHKVLMPFFGILYLVLFLVVIISLMVLSANISIQHIFALNAPWTSIIVSVLSIVSLLMAVMLIIVYSLRYKFHEADFHEGSNEPTDAFKEKIKNKLAKEEGAKNDGKGDSAVTSHNFEETWHLPQEYLSYQWPYRF